MPYNSPTALRGRHESRADAVGIKLRGLALLAIESSHAHWLILGRLNHDTAADSTLFAKNLL
jgi:hypothetical protein